MATFYLVRHGSNDFLGKALAGRTPAVHLNAQGRGEAIQLGATLADAGIDHIISSPLERTRETAAPLSDKIGRAIRIDDRFLEIDFGDWTGRAMSELDALPLWQLFNRYRSGVRIPNGETMLEVQNRVVAGLESLRLEHPGGTFAIFSHGDPIKLAIAYYLGIPFDLFTRVETSPACYSILELESLGPRILGLNLRPAA